MDTRAELFSIDVAAFNVAKDSEILVGMLIELLGEADLPAEEIDRVLAVAEGLYLSASRLADRVDTDVFARSAAQRTA